MHRPSHSPARRRVGAFNRHAVCAHLAATARIFKLRAKVSLAAVRDRFDRIQEAKRAADGAKRYPLVIGAGNDEFNGCYEVSPMFLLAIFNL